MNTPTDERKGAPSCSALARMELCPASFRLGQHAIATGSAPPPGADARAGTLIHAWLETGRDAEWNALTQAQQDIAERCRWQAQDVIGDRERSIYTEMRIGLTELGGSRIVRNDSECQWLVTGKADVIVHFDSTSEVLIIDYKTGPGQVDHAAENRQLRGLAVMASGVFKTYNVRAVIIQPLAGEPTGAIFDYNSIHAARAWLLDVVGRAMQADNEPVAGDHCDYCPARTTCPALRQQAIAAADAIPAADGKEALAKAMDLPAIQLAMLLDQRKMIRTFLHAIEAAAEMRMNNGEHIDGYEMRTVPGKRKITDVEAAADALATLLAGAEGGANAALLRCATLRPSALDAEIQKASGKKSPTRYNLSMAKAKDAAAAALGHLMERPSSTRLAKVNEQLELEEEAP